MYSLFGLGRLYRAVLIVPGCEYTESARHGIYRGGIGLTWSGLTIVEGISAGTPASAVSLIAEMEEANMNTGAIEYEEVPWQSVLAIVPSAL